MSVSLNLPGYSILNRDFGKVFLNVGDKHHFHAQSKPGRSVINFAQDARFLRTGSIMMRLPFWLMQPSFRPFNSTSLG
jgi:hypothetical protein